MAKLFRVPALNGIVASGQLLRLYLIGLDGRTVYAGGLGPFGLKPGELKAAIDEYLACL